jgi:uncharacterized protein (TIGR03435 family)
MRERSVPKLSLKLNTVVLAASLLLVPAIHSQSPSPTAAATFPPYDIVSIKPDKSGSGMISIKTAPDTFQASNISLKSLLANAYDVKDDLISGISGPLGSAAFDIEAKVLDPDLDALKKLSPEQKTARSRSMMLQILIDRFHLKAHIETKELPVYELVLAKSGPALKEAAPEPPAADGADPVKPPKAMGRGGMMTNNNGKSSELTATAVPLSNLASMLSYQVHRTVLDKTGLTGKYDLSLKWTPEDAPAQDNSTETPAPSIFTALQEQLGLKLQPAKGPVDTLFIDHVEMPTEN